jgi:hypothetical protein
MKKFFITVALIVALSALISSVASATGLLGGRTKVAIMSCTEGMANLVNDTHFLMSAGTIREIVFQNFTNADTDLCVVYAVRVAEKDTVPHSTWTANYENWGDSTLAQMTLYNNSAKSGLPQGEAFPVDPEGLYGKTGIDSKERLQIIVYPLASQPQAALGTGLINGTVLIYYEPKSR